MALDTSFLNEEFLACLGVARGKIDSFSVGPDASDVGDEVYHLVTLEGHKRKAFLAHFLLPPGRMIPHQMGPQNRIDVRCPTGKIRRRAFLRNMTSCAALRLQDL